MRASGLATLEPLLAQLRTVDGLVERTPGAFYVKSRAFLHFHEHGEEFFADVRLTGDDFERRRTTTKREQQALIAAVRRTLRVQPP